MTRENSGTLLKAVVNQDHLGGFLATLRNSKLSQHFTKPFEVTFEEHDFCVAVHINNTDPMAGKTFKDRTLQYWKTFEIKTSQK